MNANLNEEAETQDRALTAVTRELLQLRGQANARQGQATETADQKRARQARDAEAQAKWEEETGELVSKAGAKGIEIPNHFLCPITLELMRDPVLATDERTYERSAIERYLETKNTSPMTREVFASKHVTANRGLRDAIAEYLENLKVQVEGESGGNGVVSRTENL